MLCVASQSDRLTCFSTDKFLQAAIIIPFVLFFFFKKGQIKVHLVRHCVSKRLICVKFSRQQKTNLSKTEAPIFSMFLGGFFIGEKWNYSHALSEKTVRRLNLKVFVS